MFIFTIIALTAWCSNVVAFDRLYSLKLAERHFERFMRKYNRHYVDLYEARARFEIFKNNLRRVNWLNKKRKHGDAVFGITLFMDLTYNEFVSTYTGLRKPQRVDHYNCSILTDEDIPSVDLPDSFDWRDHDAVTRVKNQGLCGSCWAFSVTGNVEGQHAIKHKELVEFSEQQLVDCDLISDGCDGGIMSNGFSKLIMEGGTMGESDYPYRGKTSSSCKFDNTKVKAKVVDCLSFNMTSQEKVKQLLYQRGPISVGIKSYALKNYRRGIISNRQCKRGRVNHAALLVGYGEERGKPYWIVKNSWSSRWGEKGYYRMERGDDLNTCGLLNDFMATSVVA